VRSSRERRVHGEYTIDLVSVGPDVIAPYTNAAVTALGTPHHPGNPDPDSRSSQSYIAFDAEPTGVNRFVLVTRQRCAPTWRRPMGAVHARLAERPWRVRAQA
jgi:hypothetical protein